MLTTKVKIIPQTLPLQCQILISYQLAARPLAKSVQILPGTMVLPTMLRPMPSI